MPSKSLLRAVTLLLIASTAACAGPWGPQVVHVPQPVAPRVTPPIVRNDPPVFEPVKIPVHVTTLKNARYYLDACEAWQNSREDPEMFGTADDVREAYPGTTEESVCRWALYGRPAEEELAFEQQLERLAGYAEELRQINDFHRQQLIDRFEAMKQWAEEDRANASKRGN